MRVLYRVAVFLVFVISLPACTRPYMASYNIDLKEVERPASAADQYQAEAIERGVWWCPNFQPGREK